MHAAKVLQGITFVYILMHSQAVFAGGVPKAPTITNKIADEAIQYRASGTQRSLDYMQPVTGPVTGTKRVAIILVEFSTAGVSALMTGADINNIYSHYEYAKGYFAAASYDQLGLDIVYIYDGGTTRTLTGSEKPVRLDKQLTYYSSLYESGLEELIGDALSKAGPEVNAATYDVLGVVHAGYGYETTASIYSGMLSGFCGLSAKKNGFDAAMVVPSKEAHGYSSTGACCYGIGRALGLPNSYNTTNASYSVGKWDLLDAGMWNEMGNVPAQISPWGKQYLGWITPVTVRLGQVIESIEPVEVSSRTVLQIPVLNRSDEYFLVCFSTCSQYNPVPTGTGIMIWHVNERNIDNVSYEDRLKRDEVNAYSSPTYCLVCADNTDTRVFPHGDSTDLWPGVKTTFAPPDSDSSDKRDSTIRIFDMSSNGIVAKMTVDVGFVGGTEDSNDLKVFGSSAGRGTINPDHGESASIYFLGGGLGSYRCSILNSDGELLFEEWKNNVDNGQFVWTPRNIASGIYVVHVEGPGMNKKAKLAILR